MVSLYRLICTTVRMTKYLLKFCSVFDPTLVCVWTNSWLRIRAIVITRSLLRGGLWWKILWNSNLTIHYTCISSRVPTTATTKAHHCWDNILYIKSCFPGQSNPRWWLLSGCPSVVLIISIDPSTVITASPLARPQRWAEPWPALPFHSYIRCQAGHESRGT
jgi:hypothetical protein